MAKKNRLERAEGYINNREELSDEHLESISNDDFKLDGDDIDKTQGIGNSNSKRLKGLRGSAFERDTALRGDELSQDYAKYDDDINFNELNLDNYKNAEDIAAGNQGGLETAGKFVGRALVQTGIESLKLPGYVMGAVGAAVNQDITDMTNNWYIEALDNMSQEIKDTMPVWVSDDIKNGGFADKMMSGEFWANEGADAVGFFASSILTGGGMSGIAKMMGGTKHAAKIIAGVQTLGESAAETSGLSTQLDAYWEQRLDENGNYQINGPLAQKMGRDYMTEEEVKALKGEALRTSFWTNMTLLAAPNMVMSNALFGNGKAGKAFVKNAGNKSMADIEKELAGYTGKAKLFPMLSKGSWVGSNEAFQELSQFGIEDYASKLGEGTTDVGLINGLMEGLYKGLTTTEGQTSMALGFMLGLGPGMLEQHRNNKEEAKKAKGLSSLISTSVVNYKENFKDLYRTNEKTGELELNPEKIDDIITGQTVKNKQLQLFYTALKGDSKEVANIAFSQLITDNMLPFLEEEEGLEIWDAMINDVAEVHEKDYKDLGFSSKKDFIAHIKEIGKNSKEEYDKYKRKGAATFNIKKKDLVKDHKGQENVEELYNSFLDKVNKIAISYKNQLNEVERLLNANVVDLQKEQERVDRKPVKKLKEGETEIEPTSPELDVLKSLNEDLAKAVESLEKTYKSVYNKEEHLKAFKGFVDSFNNSKEAAEKDGKVLQERTEAVDTFYKDLEEKGYNVTQKGGENQELSDFTRDVISLVDKEGNVYKVGKRIVDKKGEFVIKNVETGEAEPFVAEMLTSRFIGKDAIMSKEDFTVWRRNKRIIELNQKKLDSLNELVSSNEQGSIKANESIDALNAEITFYNEYLESLLESDSKNITKLIEDVQEAENILKEITAKVNNLKLTLNTLEESKELLTNLKTELEDIIFENESMNEDLQKTQFSFNKKLNEIRDDLKSNKIDVQLKDLDLAIKYGELVLEDWQTVQNNLEDIINDLYESINDYTTLTKIISSLTDKQLEDIGNVRFFQANRLSSEEIQSLGLKDLSELEKFEKIQAYLINPKTRGNLIKIINQKKPELWKSINIKTPELNKVKKKVKEAKEHLDTLLNHKKLKYAENLFKITMLNVKREFNLQAAEGLKPGYGEGSSGIEQGTVKAENEYKAKKENPYSSTVSVWDYVKGQIDYNNGRNGKAINYKHAALWSKTLMDIDNNKVDEYSVRIVSAKTLKELGANPPSDKSNDLYTVLYRGETLLKVADELPFAGIAFPETYFKDAGVSILRNNETWKRALKAKENHGDKFDFLYKENNYKKIEDLQIDLINDLKEEYTKWRNNIVSKLEDGNSIYSRATNVSRGMPENHPDRRDQKNKPANVFGEIDSILIPESKDYQLGDKSLSVHPGMVYVKTKNSQLHRVDSKKIGDLSEKDKKKYINRIVSFIAMSHFIDGNLAQELKTNNAKSTFSLRGSKDGPGIFDFLINWGKAEGKNWGIYTGTQKGSNEKFISITDPRNDSQVYINVEDLFNEGEKSHLSVRQYGDPNIKTLTDFLETKFLNVNSKSLNNKNLKKWWEPVGWKLTKDANGKQYPEVITNKTKWDSYNDFVLNEIVETNIDDYNSTDEVPNLTNQYVTFEKDNLVGEVPKTVVKKELSIEEQFELAQKEKKANPPKNNSGGGLNLKSTLASENKKQAPKGGLNLKAALSSEKTSNKADDEFDAMMANQAPPESFNLTDGTGSINFANVKKQFAEKTKEEVEEKDEMSCDPSEVKSSNSNGGFGKKKKKFKKK